MIYFLIPVYNEAENLEPLLKNISTFLKQKKQIIFADDGSTDSTRQVINKLAKTFAVKRVGYSKNRGAGFAFKHGFEYLIPKLKKKDLVVTMEGDNTSDYAILEKMLELSKKNLVVLASPHAKGGSFEGVGKNRVLLSRLAAILDSQVFRIKNVITYSSFYRVYPASTLIKLAAVYKDKFITNSGFSAGIELLIKLNKIGTKMTEVPSIVDWGNRKGQSKMNIQKNAKAHIILYLNFLTKKFE